jgi:hypothetical protein
LGRRGPTNISDFVVAIVVDPIQTMFGRRFPANMSKEFLVGCEAELDATASIIRELFVLRICAASLGAKIGFIFEAFFAAFAMEEMPVGFTARIIAFASDTHAQILS